MKKSVLSDKIAITVLFWGLTRVLKEIDDLKNKLDVKDDKPIFFENVVGFIRKSFAYFSNSFEISDAKEAKIYYDRNDGYCKLDKELGNTLHSTLLRCAGDLDLESLQDVLTLFPRRDILKAAVKDNYESSDFNLHKFIEIIDDHNLWDEDIQEMVAHANRVQQSQ